MKKLTVNEQEELFAQDCKLINLRYEYSGFTGTEKWAIITELSEEALWDKYPDVISRYTPFILLSMAQGEVISESHRNNDKYEKRSKQKEWEERYNAKRKAQVEAAKAAIRAEDMEKGIFIPAGQLPRQEPRKATLPASAAV